MNRMAKGNVVREVQSRKGMISTGREELSTNPAAKLGSGWDCKFLIAYYRVPHNLLNLIIDFRPTNSLKKFTYL